MTDDLIDLTDELTPEGIEALEVGQLLVFDYEGSRNEYRVVMKLDGRVWMQPTHTYDPKDISVEDAFEEDGEPPEDFEPVNETNSKRGLDGSAGD